MYARKQRLQLCVLCASEYFTGPFQIFMQIRVVIQSLVFMPGVVDTGDKLLQVSLTPVIKPCLEFKLIP
jgi:hypothetical protein